MRTPVYIANWKMFHSLETADAWLNWWTTHPLAGLPDRCVICACPPAPLLYPLYAEVQRRGITELILGGQNLHHAFKGAFTGEISGVALWSTGAQCVLVGHSERRRLAGETDELIAQKLQQAYLCGLMPVLCIGETMVERDDGRTVEVLAAQLTGALESITSATLANRQSDPELPALVIAYEPVWAIGTGRPATPELAGEALTVIYDWLLEHYTADEINGMSLLYGGSVTPENAGQFTALEVCDGVLVGGASLDPARFQGIVLAGLNGQGVPAHLLVPEEEPA